MTLLRRSNATTEWFAQNNLLDQSEKERFTLNRRLPADFQERVADRWGLAVAVGSVTSVTSTDVVDVGKFNTQRLPVLTFDGPMPREFRHFRVRPYNVQLHDVRMGKMFVGFRQSTLLLDEKHYFKGISTPSSAWITPAFASAPPDIIFGGTVAVLFADGASLYGHWMFDLLPKIEVLRRAGWTTDSIDYYVVNSNHANFAIESLKRLGIPKHKVVSGAGRSVAADRLLVPARVRRGFWTPDWVRKFVASVFLEDVRGNADGRSRRIYISRESARRRRIVNGSEVQAALEREGFETFLAENMSISEFAWIVREADVIVAPHGAGITNVAFARPGVRVLELYGAHIVAEGWLMTETVGGKHHILAGQDDGGRYPWEKGAYSGYSRDERNQANYRIDTAELLRAVEMMI